MIVISEPAYALSGWYEQIVAGLKAQARKKRVTLSFCSDISEINQSGGCIFVIGSSYSWLNAAVTSLCRSGIHPIVLSNQPHRSFLCRYSYVSADISLSVGYILGALRASNKDKIALYGVNSGSLSDISRTEAFAHECGYDAVFYNNGSLSACFDDFYESFKKLNYNAVICANDYAAVSLINHLKSVGEDVSRLPIVSYSNTLLSSCCTPSVTSVSLNYDEFGAAAFMICECVEKDPRLTGMNISVDWQIFFRESSPRFECASDIQTEEPCAQTDDPFYEDSELVEMMRVEKLLSRCDKTDIAVLCGLMNGHTAEKIAEDCFLAETALKYRLKKMKENGGVPTRTALCALLRKYGARPEMIQND